MASREPPPSTSQEPPSGTQEILRAIADLRIETRQAVDVVSARLDNLEGAPSDRGPARGVIPPRLTPQAQFADRILDIAEHLDEASTIDSGPEGRGASTPNHGRIRSGATLVADDCIDRDIRRSWPHMNLNHMTSRPYDKLTEPLFTLGMMNAVERFWDKDPVLARQIHTVARRHQDDLAHGYDFILVRNCHKQFMYMIESGQADWPDMDILDRIRNQTVWCPAPSSKGKSGPPTGRTHQERLPDPQATSLPRPCQEFQKGWKACPNRGSLLSVAGLKPIYGHDNCSHACQNCYNNLKLARAHPARECRAFPKNE
jgi:hypothetical protein